MRRGVVGSITGVALCVALGATMVPLRSHLSLATPALVLVIPVVAGVIIGGFPAGVAGVAVGFLVYDYAFIPPYYTLTVGAAQNWTALGVYSIVMLLVAQVVANLRSARSEAQRREIEAQRLYELSELLVQDRSVGELLETIVGVVQTMFDVPAVALLLPADGRMTIAASAGEPLSDRDLRRFDPGSGIPVGVGTAREAAGELRAIALSASGRPVGLLALRGMPASGTDRASLGTFANHAALALERAQLREQAMRSELLEEVDRLRRALFGAVSHDLRTPLASMKVASSTLLDPSLSLSDADADELHSLIDAQIDRLTRLVTSLLDLTRFQAGVLTVRQSPRSVVDLVGETLGGMRPAMGERPLDVELPGMLPTVDVDPLLIGQVLANLLDNADRHGPPGSPITVTGEVRGDRVALAVTDRGPGVPPGEREAVFEGFVRFDTGGRAGLGLSIAKTFVEAHGERIWVEDVAGEGARFVFTLPITRDAGTDG